MKIGILGSGDVGRALGTGLVRSGHQVVLGTRDPGGEKVRGWVEGAGAGARAGTFAEAAAFGDLIVLATLWSGTQNALRLAGAGALAGKTVIDATNPLDFSRLPPALAVSGNDSGGEQVQRWIPGAKVVKAFNIVGNAHMVAPDFPGGPPTMFFCGDDEGAKEQTARILRDFGWESIDLGGIEASRYLEPLAMVWILHAFATGNSNHAFKLLRK